MRIASIIDVSLVDVPGTPVTVLFTGGCNFDCAYCQNAEIIPGDAGNKMTIDEIVERVRDTLSKGYCITGGEPTLHGDLPDLLNGLRTIGNGHINLNTNGSVPAILKESLPFLDSVWLDIKGCPPRYSEVCRCKGDIWPRVRDSINAIINSEVTFWPRTTFVGGLSTSDDIVCIMDILSSMGFKGQYLVQDYIESAGVRENERSKFRKTELSELEGLREKAPDGIDLRFQWRQH